MRPSRLAALVVLAAAPAARAATLAVPSATYPTIQSAVRAAGNGDVVQVAAGTYDEAVDLTVNRFTFTLAGAGADSTVISSAGVSAPGGASTVKIGGNSATVQGFTITGGTAWTGAGVLCDGGGTPVLQDCVVQDNSGGSGVGIALSTSCSAIVRRNVVRRNAESGCSGCSGGGVLVDAMASAPQVLGNVIEYNSSESGAGISVEGGNALVQDNLIRLNQGLALPGGAYGGDGVSLATSVRFVQNVVSGNQGGGITVPMNAISGPIQIVNATVAMNGGATGSALLVNASGATVNVVNSILTGAGAAVSCGGSAPQNVVFLNSDLYGDGGVDQVGCTLDATSFSADPLFADPSYGNWRLRPGSPAIDAGTLTLPSGVTRPATDVDGAPRVVGASVDLGAFEYQGLLPVTASALALDFGAQRVGVASAAQTVTITNGGTSRLSVSDVSIAGDYAFTTTCRGADGLAPGASCTATVTFTPTARFARPGALTVKANVGQVNGVPATPSATPLDVTIALSGTGLAPHVALSGATLGAGPSLDFGQQRALTTSAAQRVTVTNDGEVDLVVSSIAATGPYAVTPAGCATVPAGGSCTLDVTFAPLLRGAAPGTLTVASDAIYAPTTIALSGQGVAPVATFSAASVSFPATRVGDAAPADVTLTNTGDLDLLVSSVSTTGDFGQANDCPAALAPGATCTLHASFRPAAAGTRSGALDVTHDGLGGPPSVPLSGEAADVAVALYPGTYPGYAGQPAAFSLQLAPQGNVAFSWAVGLACSGAPAGWSCGFQPAPPVTPGWGSQLTVWVRPPAKTASRTPGGDLRGALALLVVLPALALGARGRRTAWLGLLALAVAASVAACSGGGAAGAGAGATGDYTIHVTATSGPISHDATAVLQLRSP